MSARILDPSNIPLKQRSEGNIWATLTQVLIVAIVILIFAGLCLFFIPVIERSQHLRAEKAELTRKIAEAQAQQQQYDLETRLMKNDPSYLENVARDAMNLGKTNEVIVRFTPYQPEPATEGDSSHP